MAIIDLTPTAFQAFQAFKTAPGDIVANTAQPVGLIWFHTSATIVAKDAGNETHIRCAFNFPTQFSYILKNISVSISLTLGTTNNFSQYGFIGVSNGYPILAHADQYLAMKNEGIGYEFVAATAADPVRTYELTAPFTQLIEPTEGSAASMVLEFADEDAGATNVGNFRFFACFYRFTLEQSLSSQLNSPLPVINVAG